MISHSTYQQKPIRFIFAFLAMLVLTACNTHLPFAGTCDQQTKQFVDSVLSLVTDELNPVIEQGFQAGPKVNITQKMEELDAKASEIKAPTCNAAKTQAVKDALRQYMLETKNYFSTVAGRAIYGEGQVQAQLSKVNDAGLAFEIALDELRK